MKKLQFIPIFFAVCLLMLAACEGEDGSPGISSLVFTTTVPAGDSNCPNGGTRIETGVDANGNGQLDTDEATITYVCNGADGVNGADGSNGSSSIFTISPISAGSDCSLGGIEVTWGVDADNSGSLNGDEINTNIVCSGGISLINVTNFQVGSTECPNGGIQIETGIDDDGDGSLGSEEVDETRIICNGVDGNVDEEIRLMFPGGSARVETTNENGLLDFGNTIPFFNSANYPGIESITLQAQIATSDENASSTIYLYDITNELFYVDSELSSNSMEFAWFESPNLIDAFIDEELELGIVLYSGVEGTEVAYRNASIVLKR